MTIEEQNFNYQLLYAGRFVENAFGILASRFRLVPITINLSIDNVEEVVLASCALHSYLQNKARDRYTPTYSANTVSADGVITGGDWRDGNSLNSISHQGTNLYSKD